MRSAFSVAVYIAHILLACYNKEKGGDQMEHKEYVRIVKDSDTAVLFIHGIVSTPNYFAALVSLVPENYSVYNVLLDGHGKGVRDFSRTSKQKWETQIESVVDKLSKTHKQIYVVAHSLGTLLAIEQAVKNRVIAKMLLLAVPLKISLKPRLITTCAKVFFERISPDDPETLAAKECYGIEIDRNVFKYIGWVPRFLDLFSKARQTRNLINDLSVPCTVLQSGKDETVSKKSSGYLKQNPNILLIELENSGHYYYHKQDKDQLMSEFKKMFR